MHISKIVIENYKSFLKSEEIVFQPGINVIIGPNNSGKTALLEALCGRFSAKPHKSEQTFHRNSGKTENQRSVVEYTIQIEPYLLRQSLERLNWYPTIPSPSSSDIDFAKAKFVQAVTTGLEIKLKSINGTADYSLMDYGLYEQQNPGNAHGFVSLKPRKAISSGEEEISGDMFVHQSFSSHNQHLLDRSPTYQLIAPMVDRIYRFDAERLKVSFCAVGSNSALAPNAANLPEVLQVLSTRNRTRYEKFNKLVSQVFPSVKWVSATTEQNNHIQINVWLVDSATERDDLAIPLSECGTGIGQVLAILYVVITSDEPRVIIIDEPQSFLHPGAAKTLIQILKNFSQHQYIISTHSPEILSAANPSTITALRFEDGETKAESLLLGQTKELRYVFEQVGVRFGDMFFADEILWVEGPTEQKAFPKIIDELIPEVANTRVSILPLVNTGDLKSKKQSKKNARLVFEIYNKLSGAHALVPPMIGIILDREESNPAEMAEFRRLGDGRTTFISRKMFENYLLDPEAICHVANRQDGFRDDLLTVEMVNEWLDSRLESGKYGGVSPRRKTKPEMTDPRVLKEIDGARLLEDLFSHFSETRVEFRKTTHSIQLTDWLLENKPDRLQEVALLLKEILVNHRFPQD